ncbi:YegS/Rv2252/BmrU family lipid kinase [soil metagenome]
MRFTLIYNPVSGPGAGPRVATRAGELLAREGHLPELAATGDGVDAAILARRASEAGADRVIAIGGDGTIAEVAAGLLDAGRRVPLAILPHGTANVLALNLGIGRGLARAVRTAIDGEVVPIDVGRVDGGIFLISVGTGLHAEMVARADRELKRRWGVAAYGVAGWSAQRAGSPVRYRVACDGEIQEVEATMIQVMNCGAIFRPRWELGSGISPVDGFLDVLAYRASTVPQYVAAAAHVVRGSPTATDLVDHRRGKRVRIEADRSVGLQRDGESAGGTPAEIELLPRALPVVMPAGGPWVRRPGMIPAAR